MTQLIGTLPYAQRFPARIGEGMAADLPASPEGLGDMYYASDTGTVYLSNAAGDGWVTIQGNTSTRALTDVQDVAPADGDILTWVNANSRYEPQTPGASAFTGVVATLNAGGGTTLVGSSYTISWTAEPIDTDAYMTAPSTTFTIPVGKAGVYRITITLNLTDNAGSVWTTGNLQLSINGVNDVVMYNADLQESTLTATFVRDLAEADTVAWIITNGSGGTRNLSYCETSLQLLGSVP